MNIREYERLKAEAEAEFRRKIEAIETVWKLSGGGRQNGARPLEAAGPRGFFQQTLREAISLVPGEFTLRDVERQIIASHPELAPRLKRPSISGALKRMASEKFLVIVELGSGKRPSKYRKAG